MFDVDMGLTVISLFISLLFTFVDGFGAWARLHIPAVNFWLMASGWTMFIYMVLLNKMKK